MEHTTSDNLLLLLLFDPEAFNTCKNARNLLDLCVLLWLLFYSISILILFEKRKFLPKKCGGCLRLSNMTTQNYLLFEGKILNMHFIVFIIIFFKWYFKKLLCSAKQFLWLTFVAHLALEPSYAMRMIYGLRWVPGKRFLNLILKISCRTSRQSWFLY